MIVIQVSFEEIVVAESCVFLVDSLGRCHFLVLIREIIKIFKAKMTDFKKDF